MNREDLEAFAREAAKSMKTEKDLSDFTQMLTKIINLTNVPISINLLIK